MLRRKQTDAFGRPIASPLNAGTYHEEGWWEDLSEVRGSLILLALAVLSFAGVLLVYFNESHLNGLTGRARYGGESNGTTAIGGFATVLTVVGSIVSAVWGAYTASENRHRVRRLAWICAGLSVVNLIAFVVFAIVTD